MMIFVMLLVVIYLEVDLQVPCSIGADSLDGYSGLTTIIAGTNILGQFNVLSEYMKN
jgi:hypothetical protein